MVISEINGIQFNFTEEVYDALKTNAPIVGLESNVITHGLDYPENVKTALAVENAVRLSGSIPATIGIENGKVLVGMTNHDIERFASYKRIPKISSRDIPIILSKKSSGATTVASSLVLSEMVGIKFFSSAGIGGVHIGASQSMDISSDLIQFTKSKVAVVCAGAKKILDLGLTLEVLETNCVPLVTYKYDSFPAFYCRNSGYKSPHRSDSLDEISEAIDIYWKMNGKSFLVAVPTREEDAINSEDVDEVISKAIFEAKERNIFGNEITKFIMKHVDNATKGRASLANKAVLINTARIAGELANKFFKDR